MNPHLLYAVIDGAHIAFLLVLAIRLLALAPRNRNVRLIGLLALSTVCMVVSARHSYMAVLPAGFAVDLGPAIIPMNFARNLGSGLVMVLCHSVFRDEERLPWPLWAVWAVQMSLEEPLEWIASSAWALAQPQANFVLFEVVPSALQIVMLGFALGWALRESGADLVEARRKTRIVLVVVTVAHIVLTVLVERLALLIWVLPTDVYFGVHSGITTFGLLLSGTVVLLLLRPDAARFVDPLRPTPVATAVDPSRHAYDVARIRAAFESERVYRRRGSHHRRAGGTPEAAGVPPPLPDPRRPGLSQLQHAVAPVPRGGGQRSAGRSRPGRRTRAHVGPVGRLRLDLAVQPGVPGAQGDDADPVPRPQSAEAGRFLKSPGDSRKRPPLRGFAETARSADL